jgi:lysophospholipid acyltransferase (LPLAT)-like uncharacterized protein
LKIKPTIKKLWKEVQHQLLQILVPTLGIAYFYLVEKTSKKIILGQDQLDTLKTQYPHVIYTGWHEQVINGIWIFHHRKMTVLISQSRDGEYISRLVHLLGFRSARGSSSRGGIRGFLQLLQTLKTTGDIILLADGPRGPAKQCKAGVIALARRSGMPIIPGAVIVNRSKRVKSWDRTIIPYPFATFTMSYGEPIFVPKNADKEVIAEYQMRVKQAIDSLTEKTEQYNSLLIQR